MKTTPRIEEIEALSKMGDAETDISQKKVIAEKLKEKITERIKLK